MKNELEIIYVPLEDQVADALTKWLSVNRFLKFRHKLKVVSSPFCLRGSVKEADSFKKLPEVLESSIELRNVADLAKLVQEVAISSN